MTTASLRAVVAHVRRLSEQDTHCLSDRQLLDRFTREQDQMAFAELVRRHGALVLTTCRCVLRHEQDAEDAFQAVFLVLARKASSIRQNDSLTAWLYQVAHRLAVRARTVSVRQRARHTILGEVAAPTPDPFCDVLRSVLYDELERLPESYRSAVVLCYLEGRTQTEAAELLATTPDAVNSRLKRARNLLRQRLVQHGFALSAPAVGEALTASAVHASLSSSLIRSTVQSALHFAIHQTPAAGLSPFAVELAKGALQTMMPSKIKILSVLLLAITLMTTGALVVPPLLLNAGDPAQPVAWNEPQKQQKIKGKPDENIKPKRSCIILWMSGGPSQIDTFDPKAGKIALFKPIDTNAKGVQFTENFPHLAKQANHLAIIRSLTHRVGDHGLGTHLMRTGYAPGQFDYPGLGCVLAKELGDLRPELPRYFIIGGSSTGDRGFGPSYLGEQYAPLSVPPPDAAEMPLPPVEEFEARAKGKGDTMRKAVTKAFDLGEEKAETRDAYGRTHFGRGCLLARRLVERGVPVVEIVLGGWDMHANAAAAMTQRSTDLDAGWSALLKDLHQKKRLDTTLIVWMGEFGRTPIINQNGGRDHYPLGFTVALAGCGIKGGQAIGKTSADGVNVEERPVTPQEFLATIYQAVGVDASRKHRAPNGVDIPLVERGNKAVKEALR